MPLGFESVTHIRMWKPQREWIGRGGGVRAKYMSEVTFGSVDKMSSMFLEAEPEHHHSGDVSYHMNPWRGSESQALCLLCYRSQFIPRIRVRPGEVHHRLNGEV